MLFPEDEGHKKWNRQSQKFCKARFGGHMRSHDSKLPKTYFVKVFPQQPICNSCQFCVKVCETYVDLESHMREHKDYSTNSFVLDAIGLAIMDLHRGVLRSTMGTLCIFRR